MSLKKDLSFTRIVNSYENQNSACSRCKAVEVLKHQACSQNCLGDTRFEQLLAAQKLLSEVSPLSKQLPSKPKHSLEHRVDALRTLLSSFSAQTSPLPELLSQLKSISNSHLKKSSQEQQSTHFQNKLKVLEQKLDRMEDSLNLRAAEVYDLKEQASEVVDQTQQPEQPDLSEVKRELNSHSRKADECKWQNDSIKLEMFKLKHEKPPPDRKSLIFKREIEEEHLAMHHKNKAMQRQLDHIYSIQETLLDKIRRSLTNIEPLQTKLETTQQDQNSTQLITPEELVNITHKVFSAYKVMKKSQENTKSFVAKQLDKAMELPELRQQASNFSRELSRLA